MKYVLFLGGKLGLVSFKKFIDLGADISLVLIEPEHEHEIEKYYDLIIRTANENNIKFIAKPKKSDIKKAFNVVEHIDYIFSFGYRKLIERDIIDRASIGAFGTHFSPLPKYRGFAPLNWLLINGEKETAVNIFYLEEEADSGDIIACENVSIQDFDDINSLFNNCLDAFIRLLDELYIKLENNTFTRVKQNDSDATYTCSRNPEDGLIDWNKPANEINNLIRALTFPFPGAFTYNNRSKITVISAEIYPINKYVGIIPGKIIKIINDFGVVVLCGYGALLLKKISVDGEILKSYEYFNSVRITLGR